MNHRGKKILGIVLALLLMAAGAGIILSAFRSPGRVVSSDAQPAAVASEIPDPAAEQTAEPVFLSGWDGHYAVTPDDRELLLTKSMLPEEVCRQPDFEALCEEICYDAVDASFSTDGSHTILPEKPGRRFDPDDAQRRWEQAPEGEVRIPFEAVRPQVISGMLEALLYRDLLGAVTTKYNNSRSRLSACSCLCRF